MKQNEKLSAHTFVGVGKLTRHKKNFKDKITKTLLELKLLEVSGLNQK